MFSFGVMAAFWSFVLLCFTSRLCAANAFLQHKEVFQWPEQQLLGLGVRELPSQAEPLQKCDVQDADKVQCGESGISPEDCNVLNCCFDGQQCYYGNTGNDTFYLRFNQ